MKKEDLKDNQEIQTEKPVTEPVTEPITEPEQNLQAENMPSGVPLKTILLIVLLTLVAGILLYVAWPKNNQTNPTNSNSVTQKAISPADTTLSFGDATQDTAGYSTLVNIDTGKNSVNGVQVEISYDPAVLSNVQIVPSDFFPGAAVIYKKIDTANGLISFALSTPIGTDGIKGTGTLAKITYTLPLNEAVQTPLSFQPKTQVSGTDSTATLLKTANDGQITVDLTPSQ